MPRKLKESFDCPTGVIARIDRLCAIPVGEVESLTRVLRRAISDRSPRVREVALRLAINASIEVFEPQALALLSDTNSFVRYRAIEYLGLIHEGDGIRATWLYPSLGDKDPLARVEALESLMQIEDRHALPRIASLLDDEHSLVRAYAAMALSDSRRARYRKAIEYAAARETEGHIQAHFARALYELGDADQFHRLIEFLRADHYLTRCAAANSLNALLLSTDELKRAISAVSFAREHFLARADQTTMEHVEKEMLQELSERDPVKVLSIQ